MAPPFMNAYGLVTKILDKIIEARQPERFAQDFLATKLGYGGGSARAFIPLLERIGFLSSDGVPPQLYGQFRNEDFPRSGDGPRPAHRLQGDIRAQ